MDTASLLKDKVVLVVDDEVDVTDTVEEILDQCLVRKANDYDTGRQHLMSYTFDIVILDIMGVNGFELLKLSVKRGFPTVMLTAYALTPEALEKSIKLGAVSFLPSTARGLQRKNSANSRRTRRRRFCATAIRTAPSRLTPGRRVVRRRWVPT